MAAFIVVAVRWQELDFSGLQRLTPISAVSATAVYLIALVALAFVPGQPRPTKRGVAGGLKAQLVKYVPGGVWQAQPLLVAGGGVTVALFAIGVFAAASLGLAASGSRVLLVGGGLLFVFCVTYVRYKWGLSIAVRLGLLAAVATALIALSGAVVGSGLGLESIASAREVAGGWGLGVLAVPIPAGLGVREAYISLAGAETSGPLLALTHRVVTLIGDVGVGLAGFMLAGRRAE